MKYYAVAFISRTNGKKEGLTFVIKKAKNRSDAETKVMDDILSKCNADDELSINVLTKLEYDLFMYNRVF